MSPLTAFGRVLAALVLTSGVSCDAPDIEEFEPTVTHAGPISAEAGIAAGAGEVTIQVTVYDRDGEPVEAALALCRAGENCNGGGCSPLADPAASVQLRNATGELAFAPGCSGLTDVEEVFSLCVTANGTGALASAPVTLSELGFEDVPDCELEDE